MCLRTQTSANQCACEFKACLRSFINSVTCQGTFWRKCTHPSPPLSQRYFSDFSAVYFARVTLEFRTKTTHTRVMHYGIHERHLRKRHFHNSLAKRRRSTVNVSTQRNKFYGSVQSERCEEVVFTIILMFKSMCDKKCHEHIMHTSKCGNNLSNCKAVETHAITVNQSSS